MKIEFDGEQIKIARRLCCGAELYQKRILTNPIFSHQFEDNYQALICFVRNYAYERQGAAAAYPKIAEAAIENRFKDHITSITRIDAKEVWNKCEDIAKTKFNGLKLNANHNPMRFVDGVLTIMADQNISNLAVYVKDLIKKKQTQKAHELIDSIRGIGTKIASFYLRDIAFLAKIPEDEIADQYWLQPVDTWISQTIAIVFGNDIPKSLIGKQQRIIELWKTARTSPIAFNQGAWILGSEITGDFQTFQQLAKGENAKSIIMKYIEDKEQYISEVRSMLQNWPS